MIHVVLFLHSCMSTVHGSGPEFESSKSLRQVTLTYAAMWLPWCRRAACEGWAWAGVRTTDQRTGPSSSHWATWRELVTHNSNFPPRELLRNLWNIANVKQIKWPKLIVLWTIFTKKNQYLLYLLNSNTKIFTGSFCFSHADFYSKFFLIFCISVCK